MQHFAAITHRHSHFQLFISRAVLMIISRQCSIQVSGAITRSFENATRAAYLYFATLTSQASTYQRQWAMMPYFPSK